MVKNYIAIVFDGPPSHEAGRFVEVNDSHGKSIDIGTWVSRGDGSWELRIAVDKLKDDNDMTVDTSREAVQALIAEAQVITGNPFPPMSNRDATLTGRMQDTLAALLDERDRATGQLRLLSGGRELEQTALRNGLERIERDEQRIRDLEAEVVERDRMQVTLVKRIRHLEVTNRKISERSANHHDNAIKWRDRAEIAEQRIRDLEATVDNLRLISNANGDWNIKYQEVNHRAERAEAERDEIAADLADETKRADENYDDVHKWRSKARRLTAKLDSVKLYADDRAFHARGHLNTVNSGRIADDLRAILADTDEGGSNV